MALEERWYIGSWHLLLPSEVWLGSIFLYFDKHDVYAEV